MSRLIAALIERTPFDSSISCFSIASTGAPKLFIHCLSAWRSGCDWSQKCSVVCRLVTSGQRPSNRKAAPSQSHTGASTTSIWRWLAMRLASSNATADQFHNCCGSAASSAACERGTSRTSIRCTHTPFSKSTRLTSALCVITHTMWPSRASASARSLLKVAMPPPWLGGKSRDTRMIALAVRVGDRRKRFELTGVARQLGLVDHGAGQHAFESASQPDLQRAIEITVELGDIRFRQHFFSGRPVHFVALAVDEALVLLQHPRQRMEFARVLEREVDLVLDDRIAVAHHLVLAADIAGRVLVVDVGARQLRNQVARIDHAQADVGLVEEIFVFLVEAAHFEQRRTAKRRIAPQQMRKRPLFGNDRCGVGPAMSRSALPKRSTTQYLYWKS